MWLLLFADDQISKGWWFDSADDWGNSASVVGFFLSIISLAIAFPITWRIQYRIKRANQETLRKVAFMVLSMAVEDLHRKLTTAREAGRLGVWLRAFDCCHSAKIEALRLVGNPHLTRPERDELRGAADNLTQVIRYIEANKLVEGASKAFQPDKKIILDGMVDLLTNIQGRLGTRTWEDL